MWAGDWFLSVTYAYDLVTSHEMDNGDPAPPVDCGEGTVMLVESGGGPGCWVSATFSATCRLLGGKRVAPRRDHTGVYRQQRFL